MAKENLQVSYRGQVVTIITCMSPELAAQVRSSWKDGVVVLEQMKDQEANTNEAGRSWLIRTACRLLGIADWRAVDRECTGREAYARTEPELARARVRAQGGVSAMAMGVLQPTPKAALPTRARANRSERMHQARAAVRRS